MDIEKYNKEVKECNIGKHVGTSVYIHVSYINSDYISVDLLSYIMDTSEVIIGDWNIVKLSKVDEKISYLNYPDFDTQEFPELKYSYCISAGQVKKRWYNPHNPPILHRKEIMVPRPNKLSITLTDELEAIGAFDDSRLIGYKKHWIGLLKSKGYVVKYNKLRRIRE